MQRRDRLAILFYHSKVPKIKTRTAIIMICGSTEAVEPIPPHFKLPTKSKSEETTRICMETVAYFHKILGKFGWDGEKQLPVTIGMNKKGTMYDEEFLNYSNNSLVPLYPDVKDESGKRVCPR